MRKFQGTKDQRPNLLVLMTDQWRFDFVGFMGAHFVNTPNIDALARSGMVFSHCFTNAPRCAPSRICLATGMNAERIGALDNEAFLPASISTYYQRLRDADYEVGCVGKLDLAKYDKYNGILGQRPSTYRWGFTEPLEVEGKAHAKSRTPRGPYGKYLEEKGLLETFFEDYSERGKTRDAHAASALPAEAFADCFIGRRSIDWLRRRTGEYPWHLFVSFVGPHNPYDPPERYSLQNANQPVPLACEAAMDDRPPYIRRKFAGYDHDLVTQIRRQYAGSIQAIDDMVGEILAALEETGQRENTYIIFTSDHGDMLGDLGLWQKVFPYDPANRVPFCVSGPGITPETQTDALISLFDLNPTLCDLAGLPSQNRIDARSFHTLLQSHQPEKLQHREACYFALRQFRGLRTRDALYVEHSCGACEFYNMREDPHCLNNLMPSLDQSTAKHWRNRLKEAAAEGKWLR